MRCKTFIPLAVAFLAFTALTSTYGQESDNTVDLRLELAEMYMGASQVERAINILEQLREVAPENILVRQRLISAYESVKRYDDALAVVADSKPVPDGYDAAVRLSEMARLHFLRGDEQTADSLWVAAVELEEGNSEIYRSIYHTMLGLRLLHRAVAVLEQGRRDTGQLLLFRTELAYLYGLVDNHEGSMKEYLDLLSENEQLVVYVRNRLSRVLEQTGAVDTYITVAENATAEAPGYRSYREILGWLYLEVEDYPEAFREYRAVDRLGSQDGRAIFNFAEQVAEAGAYDIALAAYDEALAYDPDAIVAADALLGLAHMHQLWADANRESAFDAHGNRQPAEHYDYAFATLRTFLQRFPDDPRCADVLGTMARLQRDVFHRLDQATAFFTDVSTQFPDSPQSVRAQLELGRLAILRDDLDQAEVTMQRLVTTAIVSEVAEDARYELAQVAVYRGHLEEARWHLSIIEESTASSAANDALSLRLFILDHGGPDSTDAALGAWGRTVLLQRQRRFSAVLEAADSLLKVYAEHGVADDLRMLRAMALHEAGRSKEARNAFLALALAHPNSVHALPALLTAAGIQEADMQDQAGALTVYSDLLSRYGTSLHAPEIRRRILAIRSSGE